jgi:hypothetical protein
MKNNTINWVMFTKRTNNPKLEYLERRLDQLNIPHRREAKVYEMRKLRKLNILLWRERKPPCGEILPWTTFAMTIRDFKNTFFPRIYSNENP